MAMSNFTISTTLSALVLACGCCALRPHTAPSLGPANMQLDPSPAVRVDDQHIKAVELRAIARLELGQSEKDVDNTLQPLTKVDRDESISLLNHFHDVIPRLNAEEVSVWKTSWKEPDGWPQLLFVVFKNSRKAQLVDAIWYNNGGVSPVVAGLYQSGLSRIKPGDTISSVYGKLGSRQCLYFIDESGRWTVRFHYMGIRGTVFLIEADAATGRVTYAGDATL